MSVLRLPPRRWTELLEKSGHRFPATADEYRDLERRIVREGKLNETLAVLQHESQQDDDEVNSECTGTDQWEEEAKFDPWTEDRLAEEFRKGRDPAYLAKCYWAARKAIRKFRAAGG
eukprot:5820315-Amphidinium_carterae.1